MSGRIADGSGLNWNVVLLVACVACADMLKLAFFLYSAFTIKKPKRI